LALGILFLAQICVGQATLAVAAASDLTDLEAPLASSFDKTDPAIRINWITASSAILAQQIRNGAPYDVFLSANAQYVDRLQAAGQLDASSVAPYAVGRVAILWRGAKHHPISDLGEKWVRFVALPNPKLAPYGVAAQQALEHAGLWSAVRPKIVYGENVRQTLQLFESGNADAVITSDSLLQGKDPQVIPAEWHRPILQKAGMVSGTRNAEAAYKFLEFLRGADGQAVFARFGFGRP
jgi:molybdate transport system substrate-binding protein